MDFWTYFSKKLTSPAFSFCEFGRKTLFAGNFSENFLKKIAKRHYFSIFPKDFNKPSVQILGVSTRNAMCRKFLRKSLSFPEKIGKNALFYYMKFCANFRKFSKKILRKLRISYYFSIFFKKFNKPCVHFWHVWTKILIAWKFGEIFRNVSKIFLRKLRKIHDFSLCFKRFNELSVIFRPFGRKCKFPEIFQKSFNKFLRNIAKNSIF